MTIDSLPELYARIKLLEQENAALRASNESMAREHTLAQQELLALRGPDVRYGDVWVDPKGVECKVVEVRRERIHNDRGKTSWGTVVMRRADEFGYETVVPLIEFGPLADEEAAVWRLSSRKEK